MSLPSGQGAPASPHHQALACPSLGGWLVSFVQSLDLRAGACLRAHLQAAGGCPLSTHTLAACHIGSDPRSARDTADTPRITGALTALAYV
jgi:hypothetical protein